MAALGLLVLLAASARLAMAAPCPVTTVQCPGALVETTQPSMSIEGFGQCSGGPPQVQQMYGSVQYDLGQGLYSASLVLWDTRSLWDGCGGSSRVVAQDDFLLEGPPSDQPVVFTARLNLHCDTAPDSNPLALGYGEMRSGNTIKFLSLNGAGQTGFVPLDLSCLPGNPVRIRTTVSASVNYIPNAPNPGGTGNAGIQGFLEFSGLPPGYRLTSCQGFTAQSPVPARATSWGRLKSFYR